MGAGGCECTDATTETELDVSSAGSAMEDAASPAATHDEKKLLVSLLSLLLLLLAAFY